MADIAEVQVRASVDQGIADMARAAKSISDAMKQIATANQPIQAAAKETEKAHEGLLGKAREWRSEQVQQGRMARFYAGELLSLVPAGKEAKDSLQGLLGMLVEGAAGGISFGLALEAVKFGVEQFHRLGEAEKKAKEEIDKWFETAGKSLDAASVKLDELREKFLGVTPAEKASSTAMIIQDEIDLNHEAIAALQQKNAELDASTGREHATRGPIIAANNRQIEHLREQNEMLEKRRDTQRQIAQYEIQNADKDFNADKTKKAAEDAAAARKKAAEDAAALGVKAREGFEKQQSDAAAIRLKWEMKAATDEEKVRLEVSEDLKKIDLLDEDTRRQVVEAGEAQIAQIRMKAASEEVTVAAEAWRKQKAEQDKALADMTATVGHYLQPMTSAITNAFTGLLDGQMDLGKAWSELWKGMAKTVVATLVQMAAQWAASKIAEMIIGKATAISETQGNIAIAASGAAASQAAIPIVGPALAMAAAAEMMGTLEAITAPLLAARGGFDVPAGMNPVTQLHQEEMVLPAHIANPLRQALAGGGLGGGLTLNISAMDSRSVYRALKDSESDVMRFLREAQAGGR